MLEKDERTWAMGCHLSGLLGLAVPWANVLVPLFIWLAKKNESALINACGQEALNLQISFAIYMTVAALLCFVLIGFLIYPFVALAWLYYTVKSAIDASNGIAFRSPFTITFFRS